MLKGCLKSGDLDRAILVTDDHNYFPLSTITLVSVNLVLRSISMSVPVLRV